MFFFLGLVFFIVNAISVFFKIFSHYFINKYVENLRHSISTKLYFNFLTLPYENYLNYDKSNYTHIILYEVDRLINLTIRPAIMLVTYTIVAISILITLFIINPYLSLISLVLMGGVYSMIFIIIRPYLKNLGKKSLYSNSKRFSIVTETFSAIKEIKIFNNEKYFYDSLIPHSKQYTNLNAKYSIIGEAPHYLIEIIFYATLLSFLYLIIFIFNNSVGIVLEEYFAVLGIYALAAWRLKPAIGYIFSGFSSLRYSNEIINKITEGLNLETQKQLQINKKTKINNSFVLRNISYRYPNSKNIFIKDLNLILTRGTSVGIFGESGSGKTTLVNIILGLLKPISGGFIIDNKTIKYEEIKSLYHNIGYVPQETKLINDTLRNNIFFNQKIEIKEKKKWLDQILSISTINEFIKTLPKGLETQIGDNGAILSGGQKQRVGIARALYKNPDIVIFDESTNSLDSKIEKEFLDKLELNKNHKKIYIFITHSKDVLKYCDNIIFMKDGHIIEENTFHKLHKNNKEFRKLINTYGNYISQVK